MKIGEQSIRLVELTLAIIAIVLSIVAMIAPTRLARESNSLAREALAMARQSNDIAVGARQEYARISITSYHEKWNVTATAKLSGRHARQRQIMQLPSRTERTFVVENKGVVPIDAFLMRLIPLPGFTRSEVLHAPGGNTVTDYLRSRYEESYENLPQRDLNVALSEQLLPRGTVYVDVTGPLLQLLAVINVKHPNEVHRSLVNVVFLPRRVGSNLPTNTRFGDVDRAVVEVTFIPAEVRRGLRETDIQVSALVAPPP